MLKNYLLIAFVALLNYRCASIPDVPICTEISINKGWCTNTISNVEYYVEDNKENPLGMSWFELSPTMVYLPHGSWAKIKAYIQKQCKKSNRCDEASGWESKVKKLDAHVGR